MVNMNTGNTAKALHMDVQGFAAAEIVPEALIVQASTLAGNVEGDEPAVRVPYIDVDDDAGFVAEGDAIPEADPDTSEVVIHTGKVAVLAKVSREQYAQSSAAELLSGSIRRAIIKKANNAFIAQAAPTGAATNPPAGLLNLGLSDGGTVDANLDAVVDAIMGVEASFGTATHVLANPAAWASMMKLKTGTGSNQSLVGAGTEDAQRLLLSTPVLVSPAVPANKLLVVDRASILSAYGQVLLAVSDQAYFGSDSIGIRATWRFGQKIVDSARVVELTIASE